MSDTNTASSGGKPKLECFLIDTGHSSDLPLPRLTQAYQHFHSEKTRLKKGHTQTRPAFTKLAQLIIDLEKTGLVIDLRAAGVPPTGGSMNRLLFRVGLFDGKSSAQSQQIGEMLGDVQEMIKEVMAESPELRRFPAALEYTPYTLRHSASTPIGKQKFFAVDNTSIVINANSQPAVANVAEAVRALAERKREEVRQAAALAEQKRIEAEQASAEAAKPAMQEKPVPVKEPEIEVPATTETVIGEPEYIVMGAVVPTDAPMERAEIKRFANDVMRATDLKARGADKRLVLLAKFIENINGAGVHGSLRVGAPKMGGKKLAKDDIRRRDHLIVRLAVPNGAPLADSSDARQIVNDVATSLSVLLHVTDAPLRPKHVDVKRVPIAFEYVRLEGAEVSAAETAAKMREVRKCYTSNDDDVLAMEPVLTPIAVRPEVAAIPVAQQQAALQQQPKPGTSIH